MIPCRFSLPFFALCLLPFFAKAQFDKANNLFQEKRYAAAVPLYEEGLRDKENLVAKSRLAFCYRMLNRHDKAEPLFAEVIEKGKARSDTYLFYAESLMSNGKYVEAKTWFLKYFDLEPSDSTGLRRAQACDLVPSIQPYFRGLQIEPFQFNSEADDNAPAFWHGGLVFTSDRSSGKMLLKEKSGWTGRDYLKLWFSKFDPETGHFKDPQSFSAKLNELNKNSANTSFTADWKTVFFSRNGNTANKKGEFTLQLYSAERGNGRWKNEHKLDFCLPGRNYMHPAISADGRTLFFAAEGGEGGFDIFMAQQNKDGEWARVKNLGPTINTSAHEAFPFFHRDGRLFFCSKGHAGFGGFDIFVTRFDTLAGQWTAPLNLGSPLNSPLDDLGFCLAPNDSLGAFSSGRSGGDDDVYLFWLGESKGLRRVFFPEKDLEIEISEALASSDSLKIDTQSIDFEQTGAVKTVQVPIGPATTDHLENSREAPLSKIAVPTEPEPVQPRRSIFSGEEKPLAAPAPPDTMPRRVAVLTETFEEKQVGGEPPKSIFAEREVTPKKTPLDTLVQSKPEAAPDSTATKPEAHPDEIGTRLATQNPQPKTLPDLDAALQTDSASIGGTTYILRGLRYDSDAATALPPDVAPEVALLLNLLLRYPNLRLEIGGHTESLGDSTQNMAISQARAEALAQALRDKGIAPERLAAKGYGGQHPLNECALGVGCPMEKHAENRRIEVRALGF